MFSNIKVLCLRVLTIFFVVLPFGNIDTNCLAMQVGEQLTNDDVANLLTILKDLGNGDQGLWQRNRADGGKETLKTHLWSNHRGKLQRRNVVTNGDHSAIIPVAGGLYASIDAITVAVAGVVAAVNNMIWESIKKEINQRGIPPRNRIENFNDLANGFSGLPEDKKTIVVNAISRLTRLEGSNFRINISSDNINVRIVKTGSTEAKAPTTLCIYRTGNQRQATTPSTVFLD